MKYVLIDTNSWIDLYLEAAEEKNLDQLLKWEKDGKIRFLLPDTLQQELQKQKKTQLDLLDRKIKGLAVSTAEETKRKLKEAYRNTESKILKIEAVLHKAIKIKITKKVHEIVGVRYTKGLAPFHRPNSHNDAYIYFSTVEYLLKYKIESFAFITRNIKDFGAPENLNEILHPELVIPGIETQYFSPVALAVYKMKGELGADANPDTMSTADYTEIFYFAEAGENSKVIDQLYHALDKYHDQLPFIPTDMLARIHPFKTDNFRHPEAYHSSFQLNSNNDKLMQFFVSFKIGKVNSVHFVTDEYKGAEKKSKEKILEIVKKLNYNLINTINGVGTSALAEIRLTKNELCNCVRCTYNRFDIYQAFTLLNPGPQENIHDTLKQAYMHYQFQRYGVAVKLFYHVYEKTLEKDEHILMFICLTNLKRLSRLISNYGNDKDPVAMEILRKIGKISLRQTRSAIPLSNPFVNEVVDWIADDNFHGKALENITGTVEKIRDHHNTQLSGGFSSNSNFDVLISQFAELDLFLETNYLVYNNYLEFEKVIDRLLEGLLMSYSFNPGQSSRIVYLNDYLMSRIIMFGKTENIIKYYNKFQLASLKYKKDNKSKSEIPSLAKTFFSGLNKLYSSDDYKSTTHFLIFDKNRRILNNFLVVLTLAEDKYDFDEILLSFFPLLDQKELIRRDEVNALADFISRKGKYISDLVLKKLLKFAIENKHLHERKIFQAFNNVVNNDQKGILITNRSIFESVQNSFLGNCHLCDHVHTDILLPVVPLLIPKFKKEMVELLLNSLNHKFNADMYYMLSIGGIIDYSLHLDKFKELCVRPLSKKEGPVHPFMQGETVLYRLGELLNLYFKNGLSTKEEFFEKFKGFSDYYDWILDPDEFNYKKFNPLWILEYQTTYYLQRIFSSANLKKHLIAYLKTAKHPILSNLFIQYYK